ncbi:MAG TPA: hypothetical protein PKH69_03625 [Thiobacillaceae bacterium]|nr:hypothetical protein [Thiobacillaceae bacterium]HNU63176.1 hypothetical protein [Thiobacillaceae bacterium]
MYPRYYARRRVNPYKGVVEVVDVGDATAHSFDGLRWHLRADDGYGLVRPVGVWQADGGLLAGRPGAAPELLAALETRPALPFPLTDLWELWLLHGQTGLPLALLASASAGEPRVATPDPQWHAFVQKYQGFHSAALARHADGDAAGSHGERLALLVNQAARPEVGAQWFLRDASGAGQGADGPGLPAAWQGRSMPAECFPELLLSAATPGAGNSRLEQSAIDDYHAALAPLLLLWPRLRDTTRERLEIQARDKPRWLARIHRLLPRVMDPARLNAVLVAARLEQAQDRTLDDWIEN